MGHLVQFAEFHPETDVGLVRAIAFDSFVIGHLWDSIHLNPADGLQQVERKPPKGLQDVLLLHKGHLTVDLGKLRLPVCPQVLVPEAFNDLKIFVHAPDHEQLLKGLRGLRQGVELPYVHPAGNHKIPGPFRGGFDQVRGFYFYKAIFGKVFPYLHGYLRTEDQVSLNRTAADIQIPVFHPKFFAPVRIFFNGKRRGEGRVEHTDFRYKDLYIPCRDLRVF